jgi:YidC/Oxa1 family membrane protein insertase
LNILVKPLTSFFELINSGVTGIVGNLTVAYLIDLFIFTAIIKFVLLPLTIAQTRSTVKMGEVQPKLKELQEKYKKDPQTLQQKQMELYKENKVNPFAGCLPLLIQFPIFIAMYGVIQNFSGFKEVPFFLIQGNLKQPLTLILPVVSGLTTYLSGLMMAPKGNDPSAQTQKKMNLYMSIFFVYMSFNFKSALVIYWIISNLIQLAQQYFIVNRFKHKEEAKLAK